MDFLKRFFEEADGYPSMMRLLSFTSLMIGGGIAWYAILKSQPPSTEVIGIFVGASFGGKIWQKSIEAKAAPTVVNNFVDKQDR